MTNEEIIYEKVRFTPQQVDGAYVNALVQLVNACQVQDVKVNTVQLFQGGWRVTFEDFDGDAICHDHSYGSPYYWSSVYGTKHENDWTREAPWETIGFPWDGDDVSVHTSEELAFYLRCYKVGVSPWEYPENENEDC